MTVQRLLKWLILNCQWRMFVVLCITVVLSKTAARLQVRCRLLYLNLLLNCGKMCRCIVLTWVTKWAVSRYLWISVTACNLLYMCVYVHSRIYSVKASTHWFILTIVMSSSGVYLCLKMNWRPAVIVLCRTVAVRFPAESLWNLVRVVPSFVLTSLCRIQCAAL